MRLIKSNIFNFQRVLIALAATQEVPRHALLHSRGSRKVPATSRGAQFPPSSSRGGIILPAWSGKYSRSSRRISRGGALHRKDERNSRVVPPFSESPRCLTPFQGNLFSLHCVDFQAEDRFTPRWHVGQPCGKASWESLVGKPPGKATDSLILPKGSAILLLQLGGKRTCMPPLERRTDSPGETPEVPQDPCQHWRGMLRFRHRLHTRT